MIILPGTKSTIADLLWLRQSGMEAAICQREAKGCLIFGICGGYQMLGAKVSDPDRVEAAGVTELAGMGLLDMETVFFGDKVTRQTSGTFGEVPGILSGLSGMGYTGYEIHMGRSGNEQAIRCNGNVYGSYIHGIFDAPGVADTILKALCRKKGIDESTIHSFDREAYRQEQYDILAAAVREGLDMNYVYRVLNREV